MKLQSLFIGLTVRHPQYGIGTIKSLNEHSAEIRFQDQVRTIAPEAAGLEPAEAQVEISGLNQPLRTFLSEAAASILQQMGVESPDASVEGLGTRWRNGTLVLRSADASIQAKEVPLETFFHKIVMMRNNLRVLEQKINAHPQLSDAEKVEMQSYITRCYGSMTTFNILFRAKEDQFSA